MNKNTLFLIIAVLLLASCKSSKNAEVKTVLPGVETILPDSTIVVNPAEGDADDFTARIHVSIAMNGQNISTRGTLRMRKGEVVQLSLLDPFLNMTEVGRLEISPENFLLINRIDNEYILATYDELNALTQMSPALSFSLIEEYFWREAQRTDTDSFSYSIGGMSLDLRLSDKGNSSKWDAHTKPSSRYKQVDIQKIAKSLKQ